MIQTKTLKTVYLFFMVFFINNLLAQTSPLQKGYYISTTNDSITGYFNLEKIKSNRIHFYRTIDKQDRIVLLPSKVKKIVTQDSNIVYSQDVFVKDTIEKIFLYNLVLGEASLFIGKLISSEKEVFYVLTSKKEMKKINEANPNALLFALYPQCVNALSNNLRYNSDDLSKNFIKLNECLNPKKIVVKNKKLDTHLMSYGSRVMVANNKPSTALWWNTSTPYAYQNFGLGLDASFHFNKNLSFDFGIYFTRRKILVDSFHIVNVLTYYKDQRPLYWYTLYYHSDIDVRFSTWELPLQLNYHINTISKKWKPFVSAGVSLLYSTNFRTLKDLDLPQQVEYGTSTPSPSSLGIILPSYQAKSITVEGRDHYSLCASVGTYYKLTEHSFLNMGIKYAYDSQYFKGSVSSIHTKNNRLEIFLGYIFDKVKNKN